MSEFYHRFWLVEKESGYLLGETILGIAHFYGLLGGEK